MGLFDFFQKGREEKLPNAAPKTPDLGLGQDSAPVRHEVVAGESLSKISKNYYGDAMKWKLIYEANKDSIPNPDLIHPGQILVIPKASPSEKTGL